MQARLGAGRELKRLVDYLWENESVHLLASGIYSRGTGLVVLTDLRLLFLKYGLVKQTVDFPIVKISSVQWSGGIGVGSLTVYTSGNKAEIKQINKKDGQQISDLLRRRLARRAGSAPTHPASPPLASNDLYEQLRKLGELRDAGVLSPEEFESKKRTLMDRI